MENTNQEEKQCCPRLDPAQWDGKVFDWNNKKFIKDSVRTFMYIPLNFGGVMTRMMAKVEKAGAKTPDNICLSDHPSKFKMDVYLAVDKEVEGAQNVTLSGRFLSKVYEGNFKQTGEWCNDFAKYATEKGMKIKKWFMWYTTCPKCAMKYGKNYVVIFGQIE